MDSHYFNAGNKAHQLIWACDNADQSRRKYFFNVPKGNPVIYFLWSNLFGIIYIGQTTNLPQRISAHRSSKKFDDVFWKSIPIEISRYREELESLCLLYLNKETIHNKRYPKKTKKAIKHNPIDSFWFSKWVNEKMLEEQNLKKTFRKWRNDRMLEEIIERKNRDKKSFCIY